MKPTFYLRKSKPTKSQILIKTNIWPNVEHKEIIGRVIRIAQTFRTKKAAVFISRRQGRTYQRPIWASRTNASPITRQYIPCDYHTRFRAFVLDDRGENSLKALMENRYHINMFYDVAARGKWALWLLAKVEYKVWEFLRRRSRYLEDSEGVRIRSEPILVLEKRLYW